MNSATTTFVLLLAAFTLHTGCLFGRVQEGVYPYEPVHPTVEGRERLQREKREMLEIEDLVISEGSIATWSRKIAADLEVRHADGTLVYRGPVFAYIGFRGSVGIHSNISDSTKLNFVHQRGLVLGLNGMAIGGKRRFTVDPQLVCSEVRDTCTFVGPDHKGKKVLVRRERLFVQATLTEACILQVKVLFSGPMGKKTKLVGCRRPDYPKRDPSLPVWHLY